MGAFDTRGGSPRHDPAADYDPPEGEHSSRWWNRQMVLLQDIAEGKVKPTGNEPEELCPIIEAIVRGDFQRTLEAAPAQAGGATKGGAPPRCGSIFNAHRCDRTAGHAGQCRVELTGATWWTREAYDASPEGRAEP